MAEDLLKSVEKSSEEILESNEQDAVLEKQVSQADSKRLEKVLEGLSGLSNQIKTSRVQQKKQQENHQAELAHLKETHASEKASLKKEYEKKLEESEEILLMAQMEQEEHQAALSELKQAHSSEISSVKAEQAKILEEKEEMIAQIRAEHQNAIELIKKDYDAVLSMAEGLLEEVTPAEEAAQGAEIVQLRVDNPN
ncbi:m protein repeat protein, partial [Lasius niger]